MILMLSFLSMSMNILRFSHIQAIQALIQNLVLGWAKQVVFFIECGA